MLAKRMFIFTNASSQFSSDVLFMRQLINRRLILKIVSCVSTFKNVFDTA